MAGTILLNFNALAQNGSFYDSITVSNKEVVQTTPGGGNPGTLQISTGEDNVTFGDMNAPGWVFIQNLDDTNYVEWGFATGVYGGKLEPGEFAVFRLTTGAGLFLSADTAACYVNIRCFED